jgi:hypothetical protein
MPARRSTLVLVSFLAACGKAGAPELAPERTASVPLAPGAAPAEASGMSPGQASAPERDATGHASDGGKGTTADDRPEEGAKAQDGEADVGTKGAETEVTPPTKSEPSPEPSTSKTAPSTEPDPSLQTEPSPDLDPSPQTAPSPKTEPAPLAANRSDLVLVKASLTNAIIDRLPDQTRTEWRVGETSEFLLWMEWKGARSEAMLVSVWKQEGRERWRFPFTVGQGKTWRTWVKRRVNRKDVGAWTVEIVDGAGHVYRTLRFRILGP